MYPLIPALLVMQVEFVCDGGAYSPQSASISKLVNINEALSMRKHFTPSIFFSFAFSTPLVSDVFIPPSTYITSEAGFRLGTGAAWIIIKP